MKKIESFKNEIFLREIRRERLYPKLEELCTSAEKITWNKRELRYSDEDPSYYIYLRIADAINRYEMLIALCKDLKSQGVKLQSGFYEEEDDYYESFFSAWIVDAKKYLKKLRPYVLEFTKGFSDERKRQEIEKEITGKYFKGWYLKEK